MSNIASSTTPHNRIARVFYTLEEWAGTISLIVLAVFPLLEILLRVLGTGILGLGGYLAHFVLITGFAGGMIAARKGRHLAIGGSEMLPKRFRPVVKYISTFLAISLLTALTWSSINLLVLGFGPDQTIGIVPVRLFVSILPISYAVMAIHFTIHLASRRGRVITLIAGLLIGTLLAYSTIYDLIYFTSPAPPALLDDLFTTWNTVMVAIGIPFIIILIVSAFMGTPLFIVLGGVAYLLFARIGGSLAVIPNEGYNMLTGFSIPAIALFTFAGYLLSESKAGERLVNVFQTLFGWMPGGLIITAVVASAFFTSFTGASGVTILALGGLLYAILKKDGWYGERFSTGLLTSASNIGLLFAPSLAIIIYGTVARVRIDHLFIAGLLPGICIIVLFSIVGIIVSLRKKVPLTRLNARAALQALRNGWLELALPVMIIGAFLGGPHWIVTLVISVVLIIILSLGKRWFELSAVPILAIALLVKPTTVELSALAVLYTVVVEMIVHREIPWKKLPQVAVKCIAIVGGVLVILASARALSFYIIDAQIPIILRDWVAENVHSRLVFLLILNLALLITGCFMDIFSAILVVAPLVIPLGELFGLNQVHLGIIFLSNLGVGFITPPVGLDLFLSSYRFEKSLPFIYRSVAPFFLIQIIMVLLITYVPALSTFLLQIVQ